MIKELATAKVKETIFVKEKQILSSKALSHLIVEAAFKKNAYQPVLMDVDQLTDYADYILILSARSIRQVEAISESIQQELKQLGIDPLGVEGERGGQWILIDYADVVIHIFYHPLREYYDLEGFWSDAPKVKLEVPAELRVVQMVQ